MNEWQLCVLKDDDGGHAKAVQLLRVLPQRCKWLKSNSQLTVLLQIMQAQGTGLENKASALLALETCCVCQFTVFAFLSLNYLSSASEFLAQLRAPMWPVSSQIMGLMLKVFRSLLQMFLNLSLGQPSGLGAPSWSIQEILWNVSIQCRWLSQLRCVFENND